MNQVGRPIHVVSTKYDGSAHWEFDSFFVLENGPLVIATNFAGQQLHNNAGLWTTPFDVRNHFWSDRWYNVMRCDRPRAGGLEYWYCNVTTLTLYDGESIRYVDLDLASASTPWPHRAAGRGEFVENSQRMGYPPNVIEQARRAASELIELATAHRFPFDQQP
jgi:protein associated with RNAse G/E